MMKKLKQRIEAVMAGKEEHSFLYAVSILYGCILKLRAVLYEKQILGSEKLVCKVISVGNIAVGGTGKTPMTIWLAKMFQKNGHKVVIITRGYKGRAEKSGGIVSNGKQIFMNSEISGDEAFMMSNVLENIPVIVGQNRVKSGKLALKEFNPDIILLDDGFQHLKIKRDINLVLLDNDKPFGNGCIIPAGILREPLCALLRASGFILTRCDNNQKKFYDYQLNKIIHGKPIFRSFHRPYIYKIIQTNDIKKRFFKDTDHQNDIKKCRAMIFSGIAKNKSFHESVQLLGFKIADSIEFSDHHVYSDDDFNLIFNTAKKSNADIFITTEKDYFRIYDQISWPLDIAVTGIEIAFKGDDNDLFWKFILSGL